MDFFETAGVCEGRPRRIASAACCVVLLVASGTLEVVSLLADDATTAGGPVGRAQRALR